MKKNKHNTTKFFSIIMLIVFCFCFMTIAYSAINSTMTIKGDAYARSDADVRITDFKLASVNNATSSYEEFGKNHIVTEVNLSSSSSVTYYLEITNYSSVDIGIFDITGLPSGVTYSIKNYNLKDKICDDSGKCSGFVKKTYEISLSSSSSYVGSIKLNFDFREYYKITYTNFSKSYRSEFMAGDSFNIDLSYDNPRNVYVTGNGVVAYDYNNGILSINRAYCDINVEAVSGIYNFNYTGDYQTFTVSYDGKYKIELWGAKGNDSRDSYTTGGNGAYTSGEIELKKGDTLYVYVGQKGQPTGDGSTFNNGTGNIGGWNGGGASDIRLISGDWRDSSSINSRIMVAAGGGTTGDSANGISGAGGGLVGYSGGATTGGTQTSFCNKQYSNYTMPQFGIADGGCTGGNGYYPGTASACASGSAGGSSFISGHNGCVAIESASSISPRYSSSGTKCTDGTTDIVCSYHYSNYIFTNTVMIDGLGYNWTTSKGSYVGMPSFDGTSIMSGNSSNGYAKITLVDLYSKHNIKYENISGTYQSNINTGEALVVNFGSNAPSEIIVLENGVEHSNYTYANGILNVTSVYGDLIISAIPYTKIFTYTGNLQNYVVPVSGKYKIELWGAQGGFAYSSDYPGGLGAYTSGEINLEKNENLYVAVGRAGGVGNNQSKYNYFGGGAGGQTVSYGCYGGDGGGATDIRLNDSVNSRIMVAAGGGGSGYQTDFGYGFGTAGGGLQSLTVTGYLSAEPFVSTGAKQTTPGSNVNSERASYCTGKFGYGAHSCYGLGPWYGDGTNFTGGGGGGGYYGGGGASDSTGGSGGSSFISGHNGCVAITSSSNTSPKAGCSEGTTNISCSYHYSGKIFTNTSMIDGNGHKWTTSVGAQTGMPTRVGDTTMTGNSGDGYAKITLLEIK